MKATHPLYMTGLIREAVFTAVLIVRSTTCYIACEVDLHTKILWDGRMQMHTIHTHITELTKLSAMTVVVTIRAHASISRGRMCKDPKCESLISTIAGGS